MLVGRSGALAAAQQPPADPQNSPDAAQPPAEERPHNPTQEVAGQQPEGNALAVGPARLRFGGYVGLTGLYRSTNSGGGAATKFATIPYPDTLPGSVSETRLTAESSRFSIRIDAEFPEESTHFRALGGYYEMDFSGFTPGTVEVTSTSVGLRMRNAFAEVRYKESIYLSMGQAFTLMTGPKDQISTWPSDQVLSQAIDTGYLAGLVWGRYPQFRLTWRPSRTFNWAVSVENPEQQIGVDVVKLPSCCADDIDAQFNTGSNQTSVPNLMPDLVSRVAINPGKVFHLSAAGVFRVFRTSVAPYANADKKAGGGVSIDVALRATDQSRFILQSALGSGIGRYIGGLAPDVVFRQDGSISLVPAVSWVSGVEHKVTSNVSFGGYYSGLVIDSTFGRDIDGSYIGFGFPGASNSNNRKIQELTATVSALTVTTENRGSAQFGIQTSWIKREPWSQESGPAAANEFVFFAQLRYNLP